MDIKLIKPKVKGESDKYSWNLYNWMIKYKQHKSVFVYLEDGEEFDINNIDFAPRNIIIGTRYSDGCISGNRLSSIIYKGRGKDDCWAFNKLGGWRYKDFHDISDIFWKKYLKLGRCLLYGHSDMWLQGDDNRYTVVNNTRKCNWCGEWQHKEIKKVVKIERKEVWL